MLQSIACSHKSERNLEAALSPRPETQALSSQNPDRPTTLPFPVDTCRLGLQLCLCVSVCVCSSSASVCGSERETVRVFKMPCLWAQSAALIIHDNSFLTSTSSHSYFRLLQRSHSPFCCNPYWKISPTSYMHVKLASHNVRYCALVPSWFIPTGSSIIRRRANFVLRYIHTKAESSSGIRGKAQHLHLNTVK